MATWKCCRFSVNDNIDFRTTLFVVFDIGTTREYVVGTMLGIPVQSITNWGNMKKSLSQNT